jgi:hypothetical protein
MSMLNKWDYSGCDEMCFSDVNQESYKKAAEFLGDTVEDWGCGTGWAKRYFKNYRGIDGSLHRNVDEQVDLVTYTSKVDNILMRQVLECNVEWRKILENVKKSFQKKFCLVIYTPFVNKTRVGSLHVPVKADNTRMDSSMAIPEINFNKQDILDCFPESEYRVREEEIKTTQGYGRDWVIYVEKV